MNRQTQNGDRPIPVRPADNAAIAEAAAALKNGRLVVFPTETVYGLGGDATNPDAVAAIYRAKQRPANNPLILHLAPGASAEEWAEVPAAAERLMAAFWPGALTLVLPARSGTALADTAVSAHGAVALRMPSGDIAKALLQACGRPVAAPSANRSGYLSPTRPEHALHLPAAEVDMILDGGICAVGLESTVVAVAGDGRVRVLRPGGVDVEALSDCLGQHPAIAVTASPAGRQPEPAPESPGQLPSHYAPHHPVRLNATDVSPDEALLAFGPEVLSGAAALCTLSAKGDLTEAAHNLFSMLHKLDALPVRTIAVMPIPETGLGKAINDRLQRAAAPR